MNSINKMFELKNRTIEGIFIDLIPISEEFLEDIVELRNQEKNRYFLNQQYFLTLESQLNWYNQYKERNNDIYWVIFNKNKDFIGTIRIYDIDFENNLCNQGSFMINEKFASDAPYAIETQVLSLDFVFNELKITRVINEDRADNKVMNNLTKKIGFEFQKNTIINGITYKYYILDKENYNKNRNKFITLIEAWKNR